MTNKKANKIPNLSNKPLPKPLPKPLRLLDPKSDLVFKKIFGQHPDLIKSFLNSILPLPEGRLIESLTYLTPEQSPRIPTMRNTIVDVKCTDQEGRIFIVEMQMVWNNRFIKRFLFGTSKALVQQMDKGEDYDKLCPVYGLAIVNTNFEDTTEEWYHHFRLTNVKNIEKSLEGLELIFLELPKFKPQTFEHRKLGILWLRFLNEANETLESIPEEFQENPEIAKAVDLAHESSYTREELLAYDYYLDALSTAESLYRGFLEEGEKKGIAKGIEQGIKQGLEQGLEQGIKQGLEQGMEKIAIEMIVDGLPLEKISRMTKLSLEIVQDLANNNKLTPNA